MTLSPYYLMVGLAVGIVLVFVLRRLGLFVQLSIALAKVAGIVLLIILAGYAVGLWRLPAPMAKFFSTLPRPWESTQRSVLDWFTGLLR